MVKITKEDLLLAAEAAEKWPYENFVKWTTKGNIFSGKDRLKPGFA